MRWPHSPSAAGGPCAAPTPCGAGAWGRTHEACGSPCAGGLGRGHGPPSCPVPPRPAAARGAGAGARGAVPVHSSLGAGLRRGAGGARRESSPTAPAPVRELPLTLGPTGAPVALAMALQRRASGRDPLGGSPGAARRGGAGRTPHLALCAGRHCRGQSGTLASPRPPPPPRSTPTPPPLLGLRSPCGLAPPPASPSAAAHAAPPRPRLCKRRTRARVGQPGAGRTAGGAQPPRVRLPLYAPRGPPGLGLGPRAHQRGAQTHRCSPRRGTAIVKASQSPGGRHPRVPVARSPLALAAVRGAPPGPGEPVHRPPHAGDLALVWARLRPLAHPWRWRGLAGVCIPSRLQVRPDPYAPQASGALTPRACERLAFLRARHPPGGLLQLLTRAEDVGSGPSGIALLAGPTRVTRHVAAPVRFMGSLEPHRCCGVCGPRRGVFSSGTLSWHVLTGNVGSRPAPVLSIVLQSSGGSSTCIEGPIDGAYGPKRNTLGSPGSRLGRNHAQGLRRSRREL